MIERLQKILSATGVTSRRKAEALIQAGAVSVNGEVVTELGSKADITKDEIRVEGRLLKPQEHFLYLAMNKPSGVVTTLFDPERRRTIKDLIPLKERIYPVGRLDYASEGLLLLTNDGDFANSIMSKATGIEKVYHAKVTGFLSDDQLSHFRSGVPMFGKKTAPAEIRLLTRGENPWYEVIIREGRNQQVRVMFKHFGFLVEKLRRVRIGFLELGPLKPGQSRPLTEKEFEKFQQLFRGEEVDRSRSRTPNPGPPRGSRPQNRGTVPTRKFADKKFAAKNLNAKTFDAKPPASKTGPSKAGGSKTWIGKPTGKPPARPSFDRPAFEDRPRTDRPAPFASKRPAGPARRGASNVERPSFERSSFSKPPAKRPMSRPSFDNAEFPKKRFGKPGVGSNRPAGKPPRESSYETGASRGPGRASFEERRPFDGDAGPKRPAQKRAAKAVPWAKGPGMRGTPKKRSFDSGERSFDDRELPFDGRTPAKKTFGRGPANKGPASKRPASQGPAMKRPMFADSGEGKKSFGQRLSGSFTGNKRPAGKRPAGKRPGAGGFKGGKNRGGGGSFRKP